MRGGGEEGRREDINNASIIHRCHSQEDLSSCSRSWVPFLLAEVGDSSGEGDTTGTWFDGADFGGGVVNARFGGPWTWRSRRRYIVEAIVKVLSLCGG